MRNWSKWRERSKKRSAAARKAAIVRWTRYHAALSVQDERNDLPVIALRLTIEQPGQCRRVLELRRRDASHCRTHMFEGNHNCGPGGKAKLFRLAERSTHV